jgi:anaerobic C4-dicarboxylate transporter
MGRAMALPVLSGVDSGRNANRKEPLVTQVIGAMLAVATPLAVVVVAAVAVVAVVRTGRTLPPQTNDLYHMYLPA